MGDMDMVWLAQSRLRRRRIDECIDICTELLDKNPYDQAVWYLKCRALTQKNWIDDTEMEEEGVAEILMDDNAVNQAPRPGTSLQRPGTQSAGSGGPNQGVRPVTASGRPLTGFARPGTSARPGTQSSRDVSTAFQGARPGTSRPVTSAGRLLRLGTASMLSEPGGMFINVDKLDLRKYAQRPALARALCDFIIYHDHNPKKALELAALATVQADYSDWWWKARLGKCYYQLGLHRDAEKQFKSSLKDQAMVTTVLELCKVYQKIDQPNAVIDLCSKALEHHVGDVPLTLAMARVYDALNDVTKGVALYKKVLQYDASHIEAIACLASHQFYTDQPEIALRFFRRLLQIGVNSAELWNNLGLCCFYASQYDMTLTCFERALAMSTDENMADVWYNIGHVAISIGDLGLAYQAYKIAVSVDSDHAESYNNLGVLELRKGNTENARSNFQTAARLSEHIFESYFNGGLLAFKLGDFQESFTLATKSSKIYPDHTDSRDLLTQLKHHLCAL
eukprot:jgi/Mesvir1/15916/Mv08240-RA.1